MANNKKRLFMCASFVKCHAVAIAVSLIGVAGVWFSDAPWIRTLWVLAIIAAWVINGARVMASMEGGHHDLKAVSAVAPVAEGLQILSQDHRLGRRIGANQDAGGRYG